MSRLARLGQVKPDDGLSRHSKFLPFTSAPLLTLNFFSTKSFLWRRRAKIFNDLHSSHVAFSTLFLFQLSCSFRHLSPPFPLPLRLRLRLMKFHPHFDSILEPFTSTNSSINRQAKYSNSCEGDETHFRGDAIFKIESPAKILKYFRQSFPRYHP